MMKKVHLLIAAMSMVLVAAVFSAFTNAQQVTEDQYWSYTPGIDPDPTLSSNYLPFNPGETTCDGAFEICAVKAPINGTTNQPVISAELAQRVEDKDISNGDVFLKD